MPTGSPKAGYQGVLYYAATAGTELAGMTLIVDHVQDVKISGDMTLSDMTVRANNGLKGYVPTLMDLELTIPVLYRKDEPGFAALLAAQTGRLPIALGALTDTKANGGEGWVGDFVIGGGEIDQSLAEGQVVTFTAKPWAGGTVAWVVGSAT